MPDSLKGFVRYDHSEGEKGFFSVMLSMLHSEFEKVTFYETARDRGIYLDNKSEFTYDSALFVTELRDEEHVISILSEILRETRQKEAELDLQSKQEVVDNSPFYNKQTIRTNAPGIVPTKDPDCSTAQVSCTGNVYTFPAGTQGNAPPAVGGYPNYGCLGSEPCPAWYYQQVSQAGDIIISISQSNNHDVDFICWGPFNNLSNGCATGLTGTCSNTPPDPPCCSNNQPGCLNFYPRGNIVDCSYSGLANETCHILNAQVGDIYILLITNFSQQPGTITFQQTGGTGVTDCNIVINCDILSISANPTACNGSTNTFDVSGNIDFSNPPPTGVLTITDNTAVPPVSQIFNPPFTSPLSYTLPNIPCDGLVHNITAVFSDSITCTLSQQYTAPPPTCPVAVISGGGTICADGSTTIVSIDFTAGQPPFDFTYAINGIPQTPVTNYAGPFPYILNTSTPGVYTLVSISNAACPAGTISGSATVTVNPLPVPTITGPASVCLNSSQTYTTETGQFNYTWTVSPGGAITNGQGTSSITVQWNSAGPQNVTVNYFDVNGCTAQAPVQYNVSVNTLPVPTLTGPVSVCNGFSATYTTDAGMSNYFWNLTVGGTVTGGGGINDNTITILWTIVGPKSIFVNYTDGLGCTGATPTVLNIMVNPLPAPTITGSNVLCAGTAGVTYTTQAGMTNYLWNVSAGGTITAGGGSANNTVTVTWNTAGAQTVSVNYNDLNGCTALAPVIFPVTVNVLPVPTVTGNALVCLNSTHTYTTEAGKSNYAWTVSAGGTITGGNGTSGITVLWNTLGAKTITVNYLDANGCTAASATTFNVSVNTLPVPLLNGLNAVCVNNSEIYTSDPGMSNYTWSVSPGGTITGGGGPNDASATVQWTMVGNQTVSVNYFAGTGCTAPAPTVLNVNVKPRPAITNAAGSAICSATPISIPILADLPGTTFSWTATGSSPNVTGYNSGIGPVITDTPVNLGTAIETVTYAVTPNLNGCDGSPSNFVVIVYPVASVTFNPNGQTVCSGTSISISLVQAVPGTTFSWTASGTAGVTGYSAGAGSTISQPLTTTGFTPGTVTYIVTPSANGCIGTTDTVYATVNPVPAVTLTLCNDPVTTTTAQPITLKGGIPLGGTYSGAGINAGIFFPTLAGPGNHAITYSYTNMFGCPANASVNINVVNPMPFICNNTFTDVRDNQQYPTVRIGAQCWLAKNLNYGIVIPSSSMQRDNCIIEKYCFSDNPANCGSYGGLYQWDELMQFRNVAGSQGLCPPGWHVPSEAEWNSLFAQYISNGFAGASLKFTGFSGFNALLNGTRFNNDIWSFSGFATMLWSSSSHGPYKAWAHGMNTFNPSVSYYPSYRDNAFPVRCIKD